MLAAVALAAPMTARSQAPPPPSILDRATAKALDYDAAAMKWTCDETVRRLRYNGDGVPSEKHASEYAVLMVQDDALHHAVEMHAPLGSSRRGSTQPLSALRDFPSPTAWLRLFHPDTRPLMLIRDGGAGPRAGAAEHAFRFRGAIAAAEVNDIRAWEGTAWVDPFTGDIVRVDAVPVAQAERLAALVDRRAERGLALNIFGLRLNLGPTAHGRRASISFGRQQGFWLPATARHDTFDAVTKHEQAPMRATIVTLGNCREFVTAARPSDSGTPKRP